MKTILLPISAIKAGDIFFEDATGHMVRCEALGNAIEDEVGFTVRASTPLGNREFYESKGGPRVRLFASQEGIAAK